MDSRLRVTAAEHGVFLRREALALGYDDRTIAARVRSKSWHRVRRGAYTFGDVWRAASDIERHGIVLRAAVRAARTEVFASHTSAALEWAMPVWDLDLTEAHLTRTDRRAGRREAGVRQHRGLVLPEDRRRLNGIPLMSPTRTVLEVITLTDVEHALVVTNGALSLGLTTIEELQARRERMDQWPHSLTAEMTLRLARAGSQSVGETRCDHLMWRHGLPRPLLQYEIRDNNGAVVAVVDFAWPERRTFAEFDGKVKYSTLLKPGETAADVVIREKRRESLICELTGWQCVRIVWADLQDPWRTAARLRAALFRAA